jgi:plasmid stabilization system protein ParE
MADINWSAESRRDLKTIAEYFDSTSPEYSKYIVGNIIYAVTELIDFPKIGRKVPELEQDMFRERIVDGYRIIYLIQSTGVEILTIVHSRQDLIKHLKQLD